MQLLRQFPSLLLGVDLNMKQRVFRWCWTRWQSAEPINVDLGLPWMMTDGKVVLLQCCRSAVKERRPRPHCLKPLECVVVSVYLKWHSHEVRPELGYRPHDSQALQFGGRVGFLSLVESPGSAADDALFAIMHLSQDSTEACGGGVSVQPGRQ